MSFDTTALGPGWPSRTATTAPAPTSWASTSSSAAHTGHLLSGLDGLLAALADDDEQAVCQLQPGIEHVGFFRTFDGETGDGALIVVDLVGGVRLASLHQGHRDFATLDSHGINAAIEALSNLAFEANRIVAQYRAKTATERQPTQS